MLLNGERTSHTLYSEMKGKKNSYALYTRTAGAYVQALHLTRDDVNIFSSPNTKMTECCPSANDRVLQLTQIKKLYYLHHLLLYKQSIRIYASY